jgi:hypothetical protein
LINNKLFKKNKYSILIYTSEPENTPQDTVETVVVGVDVEEVKRKRGRPKKPEEEKVKKEPKPKNENETRGRKIKDDKILRTPEENK